MRYLGLPLACVRMSSTDWQTDCQAVGKASGGVAIKDVVKGRAAGVAVIGLISNSTIPSLGFQTARAHCAAPRGADEEIPMERSGVEIDLWFGDGLLRDHVPVQSMHLTLLIKWVDRIMGPHDDLVILVVWDNYGRGLIWRDTQPRSKEHNLFGKVDNNYSFVYETSSLPDYEIARYSF